MSKISIVDYFNSVQKFEPVDLKNPKCINCNECCGIMVNISKFEMEKIKRFLRRNRGIVKKINSKNKILPLSNDIGLDLRCPFSIDKKCIINSVKPEICEKFHCSPELCSTFNRNEIFEDKWNTLVDLFNNNGKLDIY
jgi:hypothetical protein